MTTSAIGRRSGRRNDITDVGGIQVGHATKSSRGWLTGTTVVVPPIGTVAGVDVRGGGPGTRETEALAPINMVEQVDAVCLSGGSAYGLDAVGGVVRWMAEHRRGLQVGSKPDELVPIVPGAVIYDLGAGGNFARRPDAEFGWRAANAASGRPVAQGTIGAGAGAHAAALKGGIGSASVELDDGVVVGALVAVNSGGSPVNPLTGTLWGASWGLAGEFAHLRTPRRADLARFTDLSVAWPPLNTTLAVVSTNVSLTKTECTRLAGAGHDGMARAIDPIHTYTDGDIVFALATGELDLPNADPRGFLRPATARFGQLATLIAASASVVTRAIVHAVLAATAAGDMEAYADVFPSAIGPGTSRSANASRSSTAGRSPR